MTIILFSYMSFSDYKCMFLSSICIIFKINQEKESWNAERECLLQLKMQTGKLLCECWVPLQSPLSSTPSHPCVLMQIIGILVQSASVIPFKLSGLICLVREIIWRSSQTFWTYFYRFPFPNSINMFCNFKVFSNHSI